MVPGPNRMMKLNEEDFGQLGKLMLHIEQRLQTTPGMCMVIEVGELCPRDGLSDAVVHEIVRQYRYRCEPVWQVVYYVPDFKVFVFCAHAADLAAVPEAYPMPRALCC